MISVKEYLHLELEFEYRDFLTRFGTPQDREERPSSPATVYDCYSLVRVIDQWLLVCETASNQYKPDASPDPRILFNIMDIRPMGSGCPVSELHYGSPFVFDIALSQILSPIGLGFVFYGAKRLFGVELEFKAYRESRRAEYLEAVRHREALERALPPSDEAAKKGEESAAKNDPFGLLHEPTDWKLTKGCVTDQRG